MTAKDPEQTRAKILQAAFEEIHHAGFHATSLNHIVEQAGITKGALFHHFKGKHELGYAVVDECIRPEIEERWQLPLSKSDDPLKTIVEILEGMAEGACCDPEMIKKGCPLNNLAQEMSPVDEGFRQRIEAIFTLWRESIEQALIRGKKHKVVRADVNAKTAAAFIVASIEGIGGMLKVSQCVDSIGPCMEGLFAYIQSLRP